MSLEKLKATAYDCLAQIEYLQKKLQEVNNLIANYKEPEVEENKETSE